MWRLRTAFERTLDALVRPSFRLGGRSWPIYGFCICSGVILGSVYAVILARAVDLSVSMMAMVALAGTVAAIAYARGTEMVTGREVYIFYHYQILVIAVGAGLVAWLDRPLLPYLDLVGLGFGVIGGCGRVGCTMAGCCHGRPHRWGVRYGEAHAEKGFARELVGVRLFPIQPVESLCLFTFAAVGPALFLFGRPAGTALATFLVGYGALRFGLEFARGDAARPFARGFSEAQWTAGLIVTAAVAAEAAGLLPLVSWHLAAFTAMGLAVAAVTLRRRFTPMHRLFHPGHVSEVAGILGELAARPALPDRAPRVACTSLGLRLSAGSLHDGQTHYALSATEGAMTESAAKSLAALILRLRHPTAPSRLLPGSRGVFHLLVETRT